MRESMDFLCGPKNKEEAEKKTKKNTNTRCFAHLLIESEIFQACTCILDCLLNCSRDVQKGRGAGGGGGVEEE